MRTADISDQPAVLALLAAAMARPNDDRFARLLSWKHEDNPFGRSAGWVAEVGGEIAGYRALLRWEFDDGRGRTIRAARAVDTATHPEHQGKGIFRQLTMHAIDALRVEGVAFIFNTPNDQSRPGYLKMGWQQVGTLRPWARLAGLRRLPAIARGRTPASHFGEPTGAGSPASEVFADDVATAELIAMAEPDDHRLRTRRTPDYLRWRYDEGLLGYRVFSLSRDLAEGAACFRLRRRGAAMEATVGDVLAPDRDGRVRRDLVRGVLRATGADYALVLDGSWSEAMVPVPGQGPTLVFREVTSSDCPPRDRWALTMGDIELF